MDFLKTLASGRTLVFDGAMGTLLQEKGLKSGIAPELWNIENSQAVYEVHYGYVSSGVDIIETNTFGGNSVKLAMYDLADRIYQINYQGAVIAKKASAGKAFVAGSVGPSGKLVKPFGDLSEQELYDAFKAQVIALAEGGVDLYSVETMSCLTEAKAAVRAIKENTDLPVIALMSFEFGLRTMMGVAPKDAVKELEAIGADVVGANCSLGPAEMLPVIKEMVQVAQIPVMAMPNAGVPKLIKGNTIFDQNPEEFAAHAKEFKELGVKIFGGCCGTTPRHLAKVVEALQLK